MILTYASQQDYDALAGQASDQPAWLPEDFAGELVETRALLAPVPHPPGGTAAGRVPVVTDGPYAETQEVLAGYGILECDSFDRATEIAGRLSDCPAPEHVRVRAVADVRPIADYRADLEV